MNIYFVNIITQPIIKYSSVKVTKNKVKISYENLLRI